MDHSPSSASMMLHHYRAYCQLHIRETPIRSSLASLHIIHHNQPTTFERTLSFSQHVVPSIVSFCLGWSNLPWRTHLRTGADSDQDPAGRRSFPSTHSATSRALPCRQHARHRSCIPRARLSETRTYIRAHLQDELEGNHHGCPFESRDDTRGLG